MRLWIKTNQTHTMTNLELMLNNNRWTIFHAVITAVAHLATLIAVLWTLYETYSLKHR